MIAAYMQTHSPSQFVWCEGQQPLGAVLGAENYYKGVCVCVCGGSGWVLDSNSRPTFKELGDEFEKMATDPSRYLVIQARRTVCSLTVILSSDAVVVRLACDIYICSTAATYKDFFGDFIASG